MLHSLRLWILKGLHYLKLPCKPSRPLKVIGSAPFDRCCKPFWQFRCRRTDGRIECRIVIKAMSSIQQIAMTPCHNLYCRPIVSGYCGKSDVAGNFLRYIATGTVAAGDERKIEDGAEMRKKPAAARHSGGWNLVLTYIDCISDLVSDLELIRGARLHSPATPTSSSWCGSCCCWALMTGGVIGRELWQHRSLRRRRRPRFQLKFHLVSFSLQTVSINHAHSEWWMFGNIFLSKDYSRADMTRRVGGCCMCKKEAQLLLW